MTARLAVGIVLMLGAGMVASADLGRMFFTPAQRATLDHLRKQNIKTPAGSDKEQAAPAQQYVSVDGVVRRSDGKSTVWLNNRAVSGQRAGGLNVSTSSNDNRVRLTVPESNRSIDLKVGQTLEIVSGTIEESYARRVRPKPEAKATLEAKATPGGVNTAPGVSKVTPPAASQPRWNTICASRCARLPANFFATVAATLHSIPRARPRQHARMSGAPGGASLIGYFPRIAMPALSRNATQPGTIAR